MTLEKENGPANLSGRDVIVWGTRNANRQRKGSLRAQRNLSAVGKILPASEMTGPKTFRRGTLTRVEMKVAVMGVTVVSPRKKNATPKKQERQEESGRKYLMQLCWCVGSVGFGYDDDYDQAGSNIVLEKSVRSIVTGNTFAVV